MFPSLYFDCQLARVVTGEIDGQYADPREKEREKEGQRRGLVCEVGHDGEARVGFGREVMAQKKFVTYFPDKEKRAYALALIKKNNKKRKKERKKKKYEKEINLCGMNVYPSPFTVLGIISVTSPHT